MKIKILIAEDNPIDALLITHTLEDELESLEITSAQCGTTFTTALNNSSYDIILCDHFLHDITSLDALEKAKKSHAEVPFIIVTSHNDNKLARRAIDEGAYDYVLKSDLFRLPIAVKNALKYSTLKKEIGELKKRA